jgi:hypothetical protein
VSYDDTKFIVAAKKYGAWRIIKSNDLIYALVLSIIFSLSVSHFGIQIQINEMVCPIYVTISATMIAVAIAGLAIVVSMSDSSFIKILKSANIYENILFSFYYSSIISGISIIFCITAYMFSIFNKYLCSAVFYSDVLASILLFFSTFFVLYSVFSTILLVGLTMRYGFYRGYFIDK